MLTHDFALKLKKQKILAEQKIISLYKLVGIKMVFIIVLNNENLIALKMAL